MFHAICARSCAFHYCILRIPSVREGSRGSVSCPKTATVEVNLLGIKIPHVLGSYKALLLVKFHTPHTLNGSKLGTPIIGWLILN